MFISNLPAVNSFEDSNYRTGQYWDRLLFMKTKSSLSPFSVLPSLLIITKTLLHCYHRIFYYTCFQQGKNNSIVIFKLLDTAFTRE